MRLVKLVLYWLQMPNAKLKSCEDSHDQIIFRGDECPVCRLRMQLEQRSDEHQGVLEDVVRRHGKQISQLHADMTMVKGIIVPQAAPKRRWFARRQHEQEQWVNQLISEDTESV